MYSTSLSQTTIRTDAGNHSRNLQAKQRQQRQTETETQSIVEKM